MPPPVADFSDDESTGESIPYDETEDKNEPVNAKAEEDEDSGEEGEDEGDGVFVVEKILSHDFLPNGTLLLRVKWKGYEKPEDETMEPEENLVEGAKDVLEEYYARLGGRPEKPTKKRKSMGRPKSAATPENPEPKRQRRSRSAPETEKLATRPKKVKEEKQESEEEEEVEEAEGNDNKKNVPDWVPKSKNWENWVTSVETILREGDSLVAFLNWKNNRKSKVSIETCYERCPKKMLQFYESHLVFKDA